MNLNRILVPLDGSPVAGRVLVQARAIFRREGAEVVLIRVLEPAVPHPLARSPDLPLRRLEAKDELARAAAAAGLADGTWRGLVVEGLPAEQILEAAGREETGLIVMTSHGRTGLARLVFGSVAERVLRASLVPVLVLRSFGPDGAPTPDREIACRRLLVPINEDDVSTAAIGPAATLAEAFGSSVVVVHVSSSLELDPGTFSARLVDAPAKAPKGPWPTGPEGRLEHAGQLLAARGLSVVTLRVGGNVAATLTDPSKGIGTDVIVMATHGRAGVSRLVHGSVAEQVLRRSRVPVLVVPAGAT